MSIKLYAGNYNNTAKKEQKAYVGYNDKAVEIFSEPIAEVYGAVWDGSATTAWTRTDSAKNFSAPNPYYAGMSGTPSSPFDDIMPWKGMNVFDDSVAGKVVAIPKFYYKLGYASGTTGLKIQISMAKHDGFKTSPAHMDRGDGSGERDVVYIGRYISASDYKSKTGAAPKVSITRATARSGIHALGSKIWQLDFATLTTIWLLYLVEFADWNSQEKLGGGIQAASIQNTGYTDAIPYHTGTTATSISESTHGGVQYRWMEGLVDNVFQFIDGIYYNGTNVYGILNPANFSDSSGGTLAGTRTTTNGCLSAFSISSVANFEWFLVPSAASGSTTTYICDRYDYSSSGVVLRQGSYYSPNGAYGLFFMDASRAINFTSADTCARVMVLP